MPTPQNANWLPVADTAGRILIVIALIFVIVSINKNTAATSANTVFNELRAIDLSTLNNPELLLITSGGKEGYQNLSELQKKQYKLWLGMHIDLWDQSRSDASEKLISPDETKGWDGFFIKWARRHVSIEIWQEIKWGWEAGFADNVGILIAE
ncbi:MAG: hypothetical protein AB8B86_11925 [Pseudomonadales bacterium]